MTEKRVINLGLADIVITDEIMGPLDQVDRETLDKIAAKMKADLLVIETAALMGALFFTRPARPLRADDVFPPRACFGVIGPAGT